MATEAENALVCGQLKDAFSNFMHLRSASSSKVYNPIQCGNGTLATDKTRKIQRWKEFYSNRPSQDTLQEAANAETDASIDCGHRQRWNCDWLWNHLKKNKKTHGICTFTEEMLKLDPQAAAIHSDGWLG